jgi:2'-hydroxyisoflavone reductase
MELLVLGGTAFLGPEIVASAQRRGWKVTLFNRGFNADHSNSSLAEHSVAA